MSQTKQPTNTGALTTLVMVFFFWGFIAASNSIFIPFCKTHFNLNNFESQLIGIGILWCLFYWLTHPVYFFQRFMAKTYSTKLDIKKASFTGYLFRW